MPQREFVTRCASRGIHPGESSPGPKDGVAARRAGTPAAVFSLSKRIHVSQLCSAASRNSYPGQDITRAARAAARHIALRGNRWQSIETPKGITRIRKEFEMT